MAYRLWYYAVANEPHGPVSKGEIGTLLERGDIDGETLVWSAEIKEWKRLSSIPALSGLPISDPGGRIPVATPPPLPIRITQDDTNRRMTTKSTIAEFEDEEAESSNSSVEAVASGKDRLLTIPGLIGLGLGYGIIHYFGFFTLLLTGAALVIGWLVTKLLPARHDGLVRSILILQIGQGLILGFAAVLVDPYVALDVFIVVLLVLWIGIRPSTISKLVAGAYNVFTLIGGIRAWHPGSAVNPSILLNIILRSFIIVLLGWSLYAGMRSTPKSKASI